MNMLAISTSGKAASAALIKDGAPVKLALSDAGLTHSETIMPLVESLFEDGVAKLSDIDAFAADVGPGSFTGVRIGVCAANAMAFALGVGVVGVSSLEALARAVGDGSGDICAIIDARNGNGYAARYSRGKCVMEPKAVVISELISALPPGVMFTGDGALLHREAICAAVPGARFAELSLSLLDASMLALPAVEKLARGEAASEAAPLYLRPTQAERLYKKDS